MQLIISEDRNCWSGHVAWNRHINLAYRNVISISNIKVLNCILVFEEDGVFLILGFHCAFLKSITFIGRLMHLIVWNSEVKIYVVSILKDN